MGSCKDFRSPYEVNRALAAQRQEDQAPTIEDSNAVRLPRPGDGDIRDPEYNAPVVESWSALEAKDGPFGRPFWP